MKQICQQEFQNESCCSIDISRNVSLFYETDRLSEDPDSGDVFWNSKSQLHLRHPVLLSHLNLNMWVNTYYYCARIYRSCRVLVFLFPDTKDVAWYADRDEGAHFISRYYLRIRK